MKRLWRTIAGAVLGVVAAAGVSSAASQAQLPIQSHGHALAEVTSSTPLYLEHARTFQAQADGKTALAHGSHGSHGSHESHSSHVSHYSSR